jgi:hypothetical protein
VKFVFGNVQDGYIKREKGISGKSLEMMRINTVMAGFAQEELEGLECIMIKIVLKLL